MEGEQQPQPQFEQQNTWKSRLKRFLYECRIVLRVTKKPGREEYKTILKVSGLGILAIGIIGFILQMLKQILTLF